MLTSYLTMQNAILANNNAVVGMMNASDRMLSSAVNAPNSQPLKPHFGSIGAYDELLIKANETKVTVLKKLIDALNKKTASDINNSTPKYAGLNYKA